MMRSAVTGAAPSPGATIRSLRLQKGWTLERMFQATGLPVSTLSKVENGKMALTYDKLLAISQALEVDLARLISPPSTGGGAEQPAINGRRCITRAGGGSVIKTDTYDYLYPSAELLQKAFNPMIGELHTRSIEDFGDFIRHPGEEYAYVLEGAVDFHCELYAPARLEVGDSIYFDSGMGHAYIAASPGRCRVLTICSAPSSSAQDEGHSETPEVAALRT